MFTPLPNLEKRYCQQQAINAPALDVGGITVHLRDAIFALFRAGRPHIGRCVPSYLVDCPPSQSGTRSASLAWRAPAGQPGARRDPVGPARSFHRDTGPCTDTPKGAPSLDAAPTRWPRSTCIMRIREPGWVSGQPLLSGRSPIRRGQTIGRSCVPSTGKNARRLRAVPRSAAVVVGD